MLSIPSALASELLSGGVQVSFYGEVWQGGVLKATVEISGGSVTQSWLSSIRRTCTFTIAGWDGIAPDTVFVGETRLYGDDGYGTGLYGEETRTYLRGLLLPLITRVKLFAVYDYSAGTETVPLGVFTMDDPTFRDNPDGSFLIDCSGWDRAGDFQMSYFSSKLKLALNLNDAADQLIARMNTDTAPPSDPVVTATGFELDDTDTETTSQGIYLRGSGKSPWGVLRELGEMMNKNIYVNRAGQIAEEPIPAPGTYGSAVYEFSDSVNLLSLQLVPSAKDFCNRVIVTGENARNQPVSATATDTTSPYAQATIGRYVIREFKVEGPATVGQAQNLANSKLRKFGRLTERVSGDCLPIPHLEVGEVVRIRSHELELDTDYILESIEFPLSATEPCSFVASRGI